MGWTFSAALASTPAFDLELVALEQDARALGPSMTLQSGRQHLLIDLLGLFAVPSAKTTMPDAYPATDDRGEELEGFHPC